MGLPPGLGGIFPCEPPSAIPRLLSDKRDERLTYFRLAGEF
jgi:hypothetical protein